MTLGGDQFLSALALSSLVEVKEDGERLAVQTREGVQKEFKESFHLRSLEAYVRTMAAFANARGGYLIYGVTDSPRTLKGLEGSHLEQFDNLDRAKLTDGLNEFFSPEIDWDSETFKLEGKTLGVIYTYESENKPVVAKKNISGGKKSVREGDILYRYNSRSERIHFPELRRIIDEARVQEARALMNQFEQIIKAGAKNTAVLDFNSSEVQGANGRRLLIDEDLIGKMSVIREGEFKETEGAPVLKLVGEVEPVNAVTFATERVVHSAVTTEDVIRAFLNQDPTEAPEHFIRAAVTGSSAFVPIHFFRRVAKWTIDQSLDEVAKITTRSQTKSRLIKRLEENSPMQEPEPAADSNRSQVKKRRAFYERLIDGDEKLVGASSPDNARFLMHAMRSIDDETISQHFELYCRIVLDCLDKYYETDGNVADQLRRATCRLDLAMFGGELETTGS